MFGMFGEVEQLETTVQLGVEPVFVMSRTLALSHRGLATRVWWRQLCSGYTGAWQHKSDGVGKNSNEEEKNSGCLVTPMPWEQQTSVAAWTR